MIWIATAAFIAAGIGMLFAREPLARMQAMLLGGRVAPGCVVAEAAVFFVLALVVFFFRELLR